MKRRILLIAAIALLVVGLAVLAWLRLFWRGPAPAPPQPPDLPRVEAPDGAQLLRFPLDDGLMIAGYLNANYREKHGYPHYGVDITTAGGGEADILASAAGVVLGTEFCDNNLGHIAVVRYDNVYLPGSGEILSLIARYYHMDTLLVSEGDMVAAGQRIGTINRSHQWYNHIHLELDADLDYPFHTPQVAQTSSDLLHRYPATGEHMLDPMLVLVLGDGQRTAPNRDSNLCEPKDEPQWMAAEEPAESGD